MAARRGRLLSAAADARSWSPSEAAAPVAEPESVMPAVVVQALLAPRRWRRHRPRLILHPLTLGIVAGVAAAFAIALILPTLGAKTTPPPKLQAPVAEAVAQPVVPAPKPARAVVPAKPTDRLVIPALGVNAPLISVGLVDGALGTPKTLWQVARYTGAAAPGSAGTAIIVGHSGAPNQIGVFEHLSRLKPGATITYNYLNGPSYTFKVATSAAYPVSDTTAQMLFANTTAPSLNLVSCYGHWDAKTQTYDQRWIVTATLVTG